MGVRAEQVTPSIDLRRQSQVGHRLISLIIDAFTPTPSLLKDYLLALDERNQFIRAWDDFLDQWDAFLCPPDFRTAPLLEGGVLEVDDREVTWEQLITANVLFPLTGHPSVVIPLAQDPLGLPIGVQLIGRRWQENELLSVAELLSQVSGDFHPPPGY